ncbi:flagellar basal body rod protein FlgB [Litoricola sp.]|nr:flagellar basal body rod protein FlgB [Litorivicinus sp.]
MVVKLSTQASRALGVKMKLLENPFGIHEQALPLRNQRLELISSNIANADTPHFKARDVDFKKVLSGVNPSPMASTHHRHFGTGEVESPNAILYRIPYNTAVDGNTVEMDVEQAKYGEAASQYQATLQFLENRISGIRKSLRGD